MGTLTEGPRRFGIAELRFESRSLIDRIGRDDDVIYFPPEWAGTTVHSVQDGEQFLLKVGGRAFFGGTDEQAFIVELDPRHMTRFLERGESAFYAGLRPPLLDKYERLLGTKALRQGDIWALPIGHSWEELKLIWDQSSGCQQTLGVVNCSISVFGTRHVLDGRRASRRARCPTKSGFIGLKGIAGDGILTAPDHKDVRLDTPHLLMRTPGVMKRNRRFQIRGGD